MEKYLEILGLSSNDMIKQITDAYEVKIKALCPDNTDYDSLDTTTKNTIEKVNKAYEMLMAQFGVENFQLNQVDFPNRVYRRTYNF